MEKKTIFTLLGTLAICSSVFSQQAPDQQQGPPPNSNPDNNQDSQMHGPPRGGPGQMLEHVKRELSASDEKWTAISPKVNTILALEHELYGGAGGPPPPPPPPGGGDGGGGPGGDGNGGSPDAPAHGDAGGASDKGSSEAPSASLSNAGSAEADALRTAKREFGDVIHQPDTSSDEVTSALKKLRSARSAAVTALAASQNELKPLVDQKQEAILVAFGILN